MSKEYPWGKGTPMWVRDVTANDSDKSFTVPAGKVWSLKSVHADITATATVGNRVLTMLSTDGTNTVCFYAKTAAVTATQVGALRIGIGETITTTASQVPTLAGATPNVAFMVPIAETILLAGYTVRVYDATGVDAAADDLNVVLHYVEYDA